MEELIGEREGWEGQVAHFRQSGHPESEAMKVQEIVDRLKAMLAVVMAGIPLEQAKARHLT